MNSNIYKHYTKSNKNHKIHMALLYILSFIITISTTIICIVTFNTVSYMPSVFFMIIISFVLIIIIRLFIKKSEALYKFELILLLFNDYNIELADTIAKKHNIPKEYMDILHHNNTRILREKNLELSKRSAQLSSLQQQINPHFLYNTLDTIRGQAQVYKQHSIAQMALSLSKIFRYSINNSSNLVPIHSETEIINDYLYIQNIRFSNKFEIIYEIDPDVENMHIPKMTLQPLVENSIHHGLEQKSGTSKITIKAYRTSSNLILSVIDNGIGIAPEHLLEINQALQNSNSPITKKEKNHSVGLSNINARIQLIFEGHSTMTIYSIEGIGTTVQITIPISLIEDFI